MQTYGNWLHGPDLKELRCSQCSLEKVDLSVFHQLRNLDLSDNPFTDEGMTYLSGLKNIKAADAARHPHQRRRAQIFEGSY